MLLIILRGALISLMLYASFNPQIIQLFITLLKLSLGLLIMCFTVRSLINYYYFFESVLIPIFILILG